jgi:hypothetical protein
MRPRKKTNRGKFIGVAAAAAYSIVPRHVLAGTGFVPPSDKIAVAEEVFAEGGVGESQGSHTDFRLPTFGVSSIFGAKIQKDHKGTRGRGPGFQVEGSSRYTGTP